MKYLNIPMKSKAYTFNEIPSNRFKEKLHDLLVAKYSLRGENSVEMKVEGWKEKMGAHRIKVWRHLCWNTMCAIDKERALHGLSKLYE